MKLVDLVPFLSNMYEELWEENLWEVWLSNPMQEKTWADFKKEAIDKRKRTKSKEEQIIEARRAEMKVIKAFKKEVD